MNKLAMQKGGAPCRVSLQRQMVPSFRHCLRRVTQVQYRGQMRYQYSIPSVVSNVTSIRATTPASAAPTATQHTQICTPVTARTTDTFIAEISEAESSGADVIELRLDFIQDFNPEKDLGRLMATCKLPFIVTFRPKWEGGEYDGPEPERLATLKLAAIGGAPYVDVELKAAESFFAGLGDVPQSTKIILSYHNFEACPSAEELQATVARMRELGADIAKVAVFATDICDCDKVLGLLRNQAGPTIAVAMGDRGQPVRLLSGKYGNLLTFASLDKERGTAPGQPSVQDLKGLYRMASQCQNSKLFGIIGNPAHHSKGPVMHNTAFQAIGFDGLYVPLLVDNMENFLNSQLARDFTGFSVTIPHKESALNLAASAEPLAAAIGATNTLVRQEDGSLRAFNSDSPAAIAAIERGLAQLGDVGSGSNGESPLKGKTMVLLGAGGAGKAIAHGAVSKGAKVIIANRTKSRAEQLAKVLGPSASVVDFKDAAAGKVRGDVLANATSVGMVPNVDVSPIDLEVLSQYRLVFDAIYTPLETRLLKAAAQAGCLCVSGVEMFAGQAAVQFRLFTSDAEPPVKLMRDTVLQSLTKK